MKGFFLETVTYRELRLGPAGGCWDPEQRSVTQRSTGIFSSSYPSLAEGCSCRLRVSVSSGLCKAVKRRLWSIAGVVSRTQKHVLEQ